MNQQHSIGSFPDQLINGICCTKINQLLESVESFSSPITDLNQLANGVTLVELIEQFEFVVFTPRSAKQRVRLDRLPLTKETSQETNLAFIERWLHAEKIGLDTKRSIRMIFEEIDKSNQELEQLMLQEGCNFSTAHIVAQQRVVNYGRSIAYIATLCYALFTIFLKHEALFCEAWPKRYRFTISSDELLHILFYTKWKLTEEELLIKDLEVMRLKDALEMARIQANHVASGGYLGSVNDTWPASSDNDARDDDPTLRSISTVSISSLAETYSVGTLTDLHGLDKQIIVKPPSDNKRSPYVDSEYHRTFLRNKQQVEQSLASPKATRGQPDIERLTETVHNLDQEQERNRILIARLLAELTYEKHKSLHSSSDDVQFL